MSKNAQSGFTLIETMVGVGLGSIVCAVAFYLMYFFNMNYIIVQNKVDTERALVQATYNLQRVMALAVNVADSGGVIANGTTIAPTTSGKIRDYTALTLGGMAGAIETVAMFLREKGGYQSPPQGQYAPAAIFYLRPAPTKSGVIFLDVNATGVMSPDWSDVFFDRVVEFSLTNFLYSNTASPVLTSAELSITMRNFLDADVRRWGFCPKADMTAGTAGCAIPNAATYKDINRKIRITFSNQIILNYSPAASNPLTAPYERTFGQLYLFPTIF